jgi:hypothetical protein
MCCVVERIIMKRETSQHVKSNYKTNKLTLWESQKKQIAGSLLPKQVLLQQE